MKSSLWLVGTTSVLALSILLWPSPASASLIAADDPVFGAGSVTTDTDSGLSWLDLTVSLDRSFDDVSVQFDQGGDFEGFRYASIDEIAGLWTHAGIPGLGLFSEANLAPIAGLMALIGCTANCDSPVVVSSIGFSGSYASPSTVFVPAVNQLFAATPPVGGAILVHNIWDTTLHVSSAGSWLVRSTPVPEPSTLLLLGSGIGGVLYRRRWLANIGEERVRSGLSGSC